MHNWSDQLFTLACSRLHHGPHRRGLCSMPAWGDTCAMMQNLHWCIYSVDRCGKSVYSPLTDRELVEGKLTPSLSLCLIIV